MLLMDMLADLLDEQALSSARNNTGKLAEVRLRIGKPLRLISLDGNEITGECVDKAKLYALLNRLMENSMYACEQELKSGYFTAAGGMRVGVCGKISVGKMGVDKLSSIGSVCIRIPREIKGCAKEIFNASMRDSLSNILILSPPGLGKTTMLRDLIRTVSDSGHNVAVADERREIAACIEGVPQLDVGNRTDVMDSCPKEFSIPMMIRSCAPELIAADEIGSAGDAACLADAIRCGVSVAATAHASGIEDALHRKQLADILKLGIFDWYAVLGPRIGQIKLLRGSASEVTEYAQSNPAHHNPAQLRGHRADTVLFSQAQG